MIKKFVCLLGIAALLLGAGFSDNGLLSVEADGVFTVFGKNGAVTVYSRQNRPALDRFGCYTRLDISGGMAEAEKGIKDLTAEILWTETVGDITVIYAYSPLIRKFETVRNKRVNVMAAVRDGNVSFGCPLLKGSY